MIRKAAVAVVLLGAVVSLTKVARPRSRPDSTRRRRGGAHVHHCFLCAGEWSHQTLCRAGRAWLCPWCLAGSRADTEPLPEHIASTIREIGPARRSRHAHRCPRCLTTWSHRNGNHCTAGDLALLPECPGCVSHNGAPRPTSVGS